MKSVNMSNVQVHRWTLCRGGCSVQEQGSLPTLLLPFSVQLSSKAISE